jgi:hypothetical protein
VGDCPRIYDHVTGTKVPELMSVSDRKIRLGVNTLFLVPGDVGGTETFLRESLKALVKYHSGQFDLILFTNNENHDVLREDLAGCSSLVFHKLGFNAMSRPARIIFEQCWLPLECRKANLDLLWSPGYTAPFWSPCPQTVTIPDLQYKNFPEDMVWLERVALDFLVGIACRRSQAIFTISEFSKQEVIKYNFKMLFQFIKSFSLSLFISGINDNTCSNRRLLSAGS